MSSGFSLGPHFQAISRSPTLAVVIASAAEYLVCACSAPTYGHSSMVPVSWTLARVTNRKTAVARDNCEVKKPTANRALSYRCIRAVDLAACLDSVLAVLKEQQSRRSESAVFVAIVYPGVSLKGIFLRGSIIFFIASSTSVELSHLRERLALMLPRHQAAGASSTVLKRPRTIRLLPTSKVGRPFGRTGNPER